jgi:zinc protease
MRVIVPFAAAFCFGLFTAAAIAKPTPPAAAALPVIDIPFKKFTLANGLTLVVHEDHKAPLVAVNVWYHIGSKDEPDARHGFAHLFEHLMFNGSQHYNDEFFKALEPVGATGINGTTNTDRTNYFETVPTAALDLALWLESDRMGYLTGAIDQAKLDEQRGVVLNEKRQGENQPYGGLREIIARESYPPGHPYSWTTIGDEKDLNAATLDDVKAWFKRYYGPNNATLVITGDVDTEAVKAKVEHYFGEIPPGPPVNHAKAWTAKMQGEKRIEVNDKVPLPRIYMLWNVPGDGERDTVLLDLLADVLAGSKTSRLYERLAYREQIVTSISAFVNSGEIGSQFGIVANAKPGVPLDKIEAAIREELARALAQGPTPEELSRIKTTRYPARLSQLDRVGSKGGTLAANALYHGDPGSFKQELAWELEATPADIRDAGQRWLGDGRLTLTVHPENGLSNAVASVDRSQLPIPAAPAALKLPTVLHDSLSNGIKLEVIERPGVPLLGINLIADVGRAADPKTQSGLAGITWDQLDEGAGKLDALAISQRLEELGAQIGTGTQRETSSVSLSAIKPKLAESLDLFATIVRQPTFPEADLARNKQRLLAGITQEKASITGVVGRVLPRLIYGADHAYAFTGSGDEKVIAGISRADVQAFYQRWQRPDNMTLLVVGDTTLAEIKPMLEARFGDWRAPNEPAPKKHVEPVTPAPTARVFLLDKPGATQSVISAANIATGTEEADNEAMSLVNTVLGGQFTSRLNLNLREDKHWSYGANSSVTRARGPQVFVAQASVERDHTRDSISEMLKELQGITGKKPLTAAEIEAAKRRAILALPSRFESSGQIVSAYSSLFELDLPDGYYRGLPELIQQQTPATLAAAATKLVRPEALTWIIVGDLSKIEAEVRALKLGPVQVLDVDGNVLR